MIATSGYFVYILQNPQDKFYIGQTSNLRERIRRHNANLSGYTKGKGPWELVHSEFFNTRSEAIIREKRREKDTRDIHCILWAIITSILFRPRDSFYFSYY